MLLFTVYKGLIKYLYDIKILFMIITNKNKNKTLYYSQISSALFVHRQVKTNRRRQYKKGHPKIMYKRPLTYM